MLVSVLMIALSQVSGDISGIQWNSDYAQALKAATNAGKPLAVFIGTGQNGWQAMEGSRGLSAEATRMLKDKYVCLYVDSASADGKELADSFESRGQATLVLSDRSAKFQAFKQAGPLPAGRLEQVLGQYVAYEVPQSVIRSSYYSGPIGGTPVHTAGFRGSVGGACRG
jgi:hypothetical protein